MLLSLLEHDAKEESQISYTIARSRPESVDEVALLKEQRSQIDAKLARLREAYLSGVEDLSSYAAAKSALEERAAQLDQRVQSMEAPQDKEKADLLMKEQISRCLEVLTDSNSTKEEKHTVSHDVIDRCLFSKANNTLRIFYRLFLP